MFIKTCRALSIILEFQFVSRRSLFLSQKKPHTLNDKSLVELHLGTMAVSADQLIEVLQLCPNLKLLRHYQLVSALYKLHSEAWKSGSSLPRYKLTNLDADFSHVVGLCSLLCQICYKIIDNTLFIFHKTISSIYDSTKYSMYGVLIINLYGDCN